MVLGQLRTMTETRSWRLRPLGVLPGQLITGTDCKVDSPPPGALLAGREDLHAQVRVRCVRTASQAPDRQHLWQTVTWWREAHGAV